MFPNSQGPVHNVPDLNDPNVAQGASVDSQSIPIHQTSYSLNNIYDQAAAPYPRISNYSNDFQQMVVCPQISDFAFIPHYSYGFQQAIPQIAIGSYIPNYPDGYSASYPQQTPSKQVRINAPTSKETPGFKSVPGLYQQIGQQTWVCQFHPPGRMCNRIIPDKLSLQRHIGTHAKWEMKAIDEQRLSINQVVAMPHMPDLKIFTCTRSDCRYLAEKGSPFTATDVRLDWHKAGHMKKYHPELVKKSQREKVGESAVRE